jgi:glycosyltransferase involved in cell wall biosynthesis
MRQRDPGPERDPDVDDSSHEAASLRDELARLRRELEVAKAEVHLREEELRGRDAELLRRDELAKAMADREAYRFAATLVAVKRERRGWWKLVPAAISLATPKPIRDPVRSAAGKVTRKILAVPEAVDVRVRDAFDTTLAQLATGTASAGRLARATARALDATSALGDPLGVLRRVQMAVPWPSDRPLVSVIIPCFNYGRFVREAVDSVLSQTLQDFELIVVEGGSTDGETRNIVRALRHPKLIVIEQPRPTSVGENRLRGLLAARGKYAVFIDADDLIAPTYLEKAALALELTRSDLAYPNVACFGNSTARWETGDVFSLAGMAEGNQVPTVAMFRTDTWRTLSIGYGLHLDLEDYDFWLRFAERGARGVKIREDLMQYRVHGSSMTDAIRDRQQEAMRRIWAEHAPMLRRHRVARVSAAQAKPINVRPGPDVVRCGGRAVQQMRIALALPWMAVGGADHLFQSVFADHADRDTGLLVYSTVEPPASMGDSTKGYARITPDVFPLPRMLPDRAHPDAILHLLGSRQANVLMIAGSQATYALLPRIRAELPGLRVVDHLFNPVGHLPANREFAQFIDSQIVANDEVRRALLRAGEPPERIEVIHHGIDFEWNDPERVPRSDALPGLELAPEDRLVLFSGRLSEEKGALRFLDIAATLRSHPRIRFAMVGDGPLRAQVDAHAVGLGLDAVVPRLGFVGDVRPYLRRADVVVVPSDIDGLPLVCLESLAMGVRVVASRVGALPDAVRPGLDGAVVASSDLAGFASAIVTALDGARDPQGAAERRASAAARFDIRNVRAHYWNVFRRVAEGKARHRTEES